VPFCFFFWLRFFALFVELSFELGSFVWASGGEVGVFGSVDGFGGCPGVDGCPGCVGACVGGCVFVWASMVAAVKSETQISLFMMSSISRRDFYNLRLRTFEKLGPGFVSLFN